MVTSCTFQTKDFPIFSRMEAEKLIFAGNREDEFLRTWYREGGLRSRIHKRSHPTPMLQCSWKPSQEVDHYLLAKQDGVYQMQVRWGASLRCKVNDTVLVIFDDSWSRHTCPKCHNVGLLLSFIWHREFLPTNQLKWAHLDNQLSQTSTHLRGKFSCFEKIFFCISKFNLPIYWSWKINNHLSTYRATGAILLEFEAYHLSFHSFTKAPTISNVLQLLLTFFFNLLFSNHSCVGSLKTNAPSIFGQF